MTSSKKHPDELFTELVTENQARIYGYVYAIVHSSADTEDLVQRTLLSLWQRFGDFEPGTDFCAWAISTARYEVLNFQKTRSRTSFLTEEMLSRLADRSIAIASESETQGDALRNCVEGLSPADRQLLDHRYFEEQKLKDMAAEFDRSEQSLSNSLVRIRRRLFDCIRRRMAREANP